MVLTLVITTLLAMVPADNPEMSGEEIESLIENLASPNKSPTAQGTPEGYDRDAQKRVMASWLKLRDAGIQAFPYLLKHGDDRRYSFTKRTNWSVRDACVGVIRSHLQPFGYRNYEILPGDHHMYRLPQSYAVRHKLTVPTEAAKWWAARQHKTLLELQIEVIEWTIAEEAKNPDRYSEKDRAYLNGFLEKARKADRPLPPSDPFSWKSNSRL